MIITLVWSKVGYSLNEGGMDICGGNGSDPAFNLYINIYRIIY